MKLLLVDHEDSFVYNIAQAVRAEGVAVECVRSTAPDAVAVRFDPDAIILSPGPGHPSDRRRTRLSRSLLGRWEDERSFLGVCLGHQLIAEHYGGTVGRAPAPVHGELRTLVHDGVGIFRGVPSPTEVARYHSLVVRARPAPRDLEVSARDDVGLVMALRHRRFAIESVQFHPESYLTRRGPRMLRNFLRGVRR
jgi:para-aminobenzoate synthetase component II